MRDKALSAKERRLVSIVASLQPATYADVLKAGGFSSVGAITDSVDELRFRGIFARSGRQARCLRLAPNVVVFSSGGIGRFQPLPEIEA